MTPTCTVFRRLSLLALVLATFAACRGPEGDPGPRGYQGADGLNGYVNVQTFTYTVIPADWAVVGTQGQPGYGVQTYLLANEIDQIVMNDGHVMLYLQSPSSPGTWIAMPYSYPFNGFTSHLLYSFQLGRATVEMYDSDFQTIVPNTNYVFKMVVVDGYVGKTAPVDWNDYEAVRSYFNLPADSPARGANRPS